LLHPVSQAIVTGMGGKPILVDDPSS